MHLLYCDETNLEARPGDFLIYGGLIIESDRLIELYQEIELTRLKRGVPATYQLKFNPGPENFSHNDFIDYKIDMMNISAKHGAKLIVYTILHDVATSPDEARRNGINTVCYHFQCVLNRTKTPGLVLIDRFNDQGNAIDQHLREKFTVGLTGLPYSDTMRLPSIVGFHYSAIGQSHIPSLVDVALGSLRFAVNAHTRGQAQHTATAHALLELLHPLFWKEGTGAAVPEIGFTFSPKTVRSARYRDQYDSLKSFLTAGGLPTAQQITGDRQY